MPKYESFEPWMLGKRVVEISTGDEGIICDSIGNYRIDVKWHTGECSRQLLSIHIDDVEFFDAKPEESTYETIQINGKLYKLVPMDE